MKLFKHKKPSPQELVAWVDGTLRGRKAEQVAQAVAASPDLQALVKQLRRAREVVALLEETEQPLPVTPEVYWQQVRARIRRTQSEKPEPIWKLWSRWVWAKAPVMAVIVALLCLGWWVYHRSHEQTPPLASSYAEVESSTNAPGIITFRSEAAGMTVVWVDTP